jgi:hypothetical protein
VAALKLPRDSPPLIASRIHHVEWEGLPQPSRAVERFVQFPARMANVKAALSRCEQWLSSLGLRDLRSGHPRHFPLAPLLRRETAVRQVLLIISPSDFDVCPTAKLWVNLCSPMFHSTSPSRLNQSSGLYQSTRYAYPARRGHALRNWEGRLFTCRINHSVVDLVETRDRRLPCRRVEV